MKSRPTSNSVETDAASAASADNNENLAHGVTRIKNLKELTLRLLREVQSIGEVQPINLESGLDFYEAVTRFEIDLIRLALLQTGGHQRHAARLLNLKVTTLNSKIKHYNIRLDDFTNAYPIVVRGEIETPQYA